MNLEGKIAVVTGANRGIGFAIAKTFVSHGAQVIACVRHIDPQVIADIGADGQVKAISLDLEESKSINSAVKEIAAISNRKVDVLVNNAGIAHGKLLQMTSETDLRHVFNINFFSQILLTQGLMRILSRSDSGSIINIASTAAEVSDLGTLVYGSSKAALIRATRSMASELGPLGVRVNAISPGVTRTDMFEEMDRQARDRIIGTAAFQRAADPQDIANAALFFASDWSKFITGQVLRVDGGMR